MKKIILFLLSAAICITLSACGTSGQLENESGDSSGQQAYDAGQESADFDAVTDSGEGQTDDQGSVEQPSANRNETSSADTSDVDAQLQLIASNSSMWFPGEDELSYNVYSYAVTDLDFNGRLEIIVSSCQGTGFFSYSNIWQVNVNCDGLDKLNFADSEEISQPDIVTDTVPVYYNASSNVYNYIFEDFLRAGASENYTTLISLSLNDTSIETRSIASVHNVYSDSGEASSTYSNADGGTITQEQYDSSAADTYPDCVEMSATFGWISDGEVELPTMNNAELIEQLRTSYEGFTID